MKSFGGKRGCEGREWGKRICGSGGRRRIHPIQKGKQEKRKGGGGVVSSPFPFPFHLCLVCGGRRKKKESWEGRIIKLLSLLLQEANTTLLILDVTFFLSFFPPDAKHKKGNQITTHKPKGSKT